jgi:Protein of unknown function (DUF2794)
VYFQGLNALPKAVCRFTFARAKQPQASLWPMDDSGSAADPEAQNLIPLDAARSITMPVMFDRRELMQVLNLYSRMVAAGEWKDYAIDSLKDHAVFSVFRRASETPLFRIEKTPKLARKQGAFSVVNANGMILKRGHDLTSVLRVFDKHLRVVEL